MITGRVMTNRDHIEHGRVCTINEPQAIVSSQRSNIPCPYCKEPLLLVANTNIGRIVLPAPGDTSGLDWVADPMPDGTRCVTCPDCQQAFFIPIDDLRANGVPK